MMNIIYYSTVNAPVAVAVPAEVVTVTFRGPREAFLLIPIFTSILVELITVKLLTVILSPKLTEVAPPRLVPLMVTVRV